MIYVTAIARSSFHYSIWLKSKTLKINSVVKSVKLLLVLSILLANDEHIEIPLTKLIRSEELA